MLLGVCVSATMALTAPMLSAEPASNQMYVDSGVDTCPAAAQIVAETLSDLPPKGTVLSSAPPEVGNFSGYGLKKPALWELDWLGMRPPSDLVEKWFAVAPRSASSCSNLAATLPKGVKVVSGDEAAQWVKYGPLATTPEHHAAAVSLLVTDDRGMGLVLIVTRCNRLCGGATMILIQRHGDRWIEVGRRIIYQS
jgi:hypothetical protein